MLKMLLHTLHGTFHGDENFVDGRESTDFLQRLAAVVRYNQVFSIKPAFVCILREIAIAFC